MLAMRKIISGSLAVLLATGSVFAANLTAATPQAVPMILSQAGENYFFTDPKSKIPFAWTPQKHARETKAAIEEMMRSIQSQQKQQKKSKVVGAAVHTVKAFPAESLYFFIGMGAVAFSQLVFDNSQNPVGLEQHIEHSLSPMGMAGFAVFMYFNNLTSSTLQTMMKNPAFMKYIPYLGMTAGFGMQSIFSHVASDPNIKFCAFNKKVTEKDKEQGVDADPCAKAIENFSDLRLAPSLTSMLLSTLMAAKGQEGIKALANAASKPVLRFTGFDIAMMLTPGKMQISGIRAILVNGAGKVLQITAFVAIDAWLNRIVTYGWKNLFDGKDFWDIDNRIGSRVKDLKNHKWDELVVKKDDYGLVPPVLGKWLSEDRSLEDQLKYFQKRMVDWRMTNLAEVYEAHQNWNTALEQLIGNYQASYDFYQNLTDRIRLSRYDLSPLKPLDIAYPLSGVKAYNLAPERYDAMMTHVKTFENYQRENIAMVAKMLRPGAMILANEFTAADQAVYVKFNGLMKDLSAAELKKIESLRQSLESKDDKVLAKGLYNLRQAHVPAAKDKDAAYSKMILALIEVLGSPSPQMELGRGYLLAYQFAPSTQNTINGIDFSKGSSIFGTRMITDYYLMQMVCGPDVRAGEKLVDNNLGYPSRFKPPMIRPARHQFKDECIAGYAFMQPDAIYTHKFEQDGKKYRGFLSYIRDNAGASIIGQKGESNFRNWWTANTTKQVKDAFEQYAIRYDEIVVKLMRALYYKRATGVEDFTYETLGLNQNGKNTLNRGPVYNGTMNAMIQEERLYLAVLEQLMNPERKYDFHLNQALKYQVQTPALQAVDKEILKLSAMLDKIQIVQKDGRERIESRLTNAEIESQIEAVESSLTLIRQALGIGEAGAEGEVAESGLALNATQKGVAKVALDSLSKIAAEMGNYGNIAHAVSWDKIHDEGSLELKQTQVSEDLKKSMKNQGSMARPAQ